MAGLDGEQRPVGLDRGRDLRCRLEHAAELEVGVTALAGRGGGGAALQRRRQQRPAVDRAGEAAQVVAAGVEASVGLERLEQRGEGGGAVAQLLLLDGADLRQQLGAPGGGAMAGEQPQQRRQRRPIGALAMVRRQVEVGCLVRRLDVQDPLVRPRRRGGVSVDGGGRRRFGGERDCVAAPLRQRQLGASVEHAPSLVGAAAARPQRGQRGQRLVVARVDGEHAPPGGDGALGPLQHAGLQTRQLCRRRRVVLVERDQLLEHRGQLLPALGAAQDARQRAQRVGRLGPQRRQPPPRRLGARALCQPGPDQRQLLDEHRVVARGGQLLLEHRGQLAPALVALVERRQRGQRLGVLGRHRAQPLPQSGRRLVVGQPPERAQHPRIVAERQRPLERGPGRGDVPDGGAGLQLRQRQQEPDPQRRLLQRRAPRQRGDAIGRPRPRRQERVEGAQHRQLFAVAIEELAQDRLRRPVVAARPLDLGQRQPQRRVRRLRRHQRRAQRLQLPRLARQLQQLVYAAVR